MRYLHTMLRVRDLDAAMDFYVNKLGFQPFDRPEMSVRGGWLRMGEQELHIMEAPGAVIDKKQHFALLVESIDEAATHLDINPNIWRNLEALAKDLKVAVPAA